MIQPKVVVHADGLANFRLIRSLGGRGHTPTVVAAPLPIGRLTMLSVAEAVLDGMGKDPWAWSAKRAGVLLAEAWLREGLTTDVIIPDTQLLDVDLAVEATVWLTAQGVTPWLVCATTTPQAPSSEVDLIVNTLVDGYGAEHVSWDDFADAFNPAATQEQAWEGHLPRLPRVDGIAFIDTCRRLLSYDDFERIESLFLETVFDLSAAFTELEQANKKRQIARRVFDLFQETPTGEHFVLLARAFQVAGLLQGWHVRINTSVLLAASETPRVGQADPQGWWDRLLGYRDPESGAIAAMHFAGIDVSAMPKIRIENVEVADDGSVHIVLSDGTVTISEPQALYLRCLRTHRILAGAGSGDRLFASHRKDTVSTRYISDRLRSPEADLDVRLVPERTSRTKPDPITRLAGYGITFEKLFKDG